MLLAQFVELKFQILQIGAITMPLQLVPIADRVMR